MAFQGFITVTDYYTELERTISLSSIAMVEEIQGDECAKVYLNISDENNRPIIIVTHNSHFEIVTEMEEALQKPTVEE